MIKKLTSAAPINLDLGLLILRVGAFGALIANHGFDKFKKVISGDFGFMNPLGIGQEISLVLSTSAEFVGAVLIIIGLYTRIGALLTTLNFLVVFFIAHAADPFGYKELPFVFLIISLTIFLTGPGKYSLDKK